MARRKAAEGKAARPEKARKAGGKPPARGGSDGGGVVFKLLFYLAVLGGVGYAALRVPIGGHTLVEHAADLPATAKGWLARATEKAPEPAPEKKDAPAPAKAVEKAPAKPVKEPPKPAKKPATAVAERETKPREKLTHADRDALERLVH